MRFSNNDNGQTTHVGAQAISFRVLAGRSQAPLDAFPFHQWVLPNGRLAAAFYRVESGYLLRFPGLADFEVSVDGLDVICFPAPHVVDATPQHLYLNQVLPLVLSKLGKSVYHASAVEIAGGAIAFVAESGRGKSTLAANFVANGYRLLTDDGLVLEQSDKGYAVIPSHPSIRLWQDSQEIALAIKAEAAAPLHFTTKTRFLLAELGQRYCDQPRPLRAVYFLGDGSEKDVVLRRLGSAETLMGWARNSFLLDVDDRSMLAAHFDRVANLANRLACFHLDYPRRFGELKRVLKAILDHAASESLPA